MKPYYGIFFQLKNGWGVRFPDADGIHTEGRDLDEALFMATDALSGMLVVGRQGREYQAPRVYDAIKAEAGDGELVFPVMPNEKMMASYKPKKRINVMVPVDLLEKAGKVVSETEGLDRSKLFCTAVEKYLGGMEDQI